MTKGKTGQKSIKPTAPRTRKRKEEGSKTREEILNEIKELGRLPAEEIRRRIPQIADDIREAKLDLPPLIPQDALRAGMLFGRESACTAPRPLHGGEEVCIPQLYRIHPEDFGRVIDRFLPRLETDTLAQRFVEDLHDYVGAKPRR